MRSTIVAFLLPALLVACAPRRAETSRVQAAPAPVLAQAGGGSPSGGDQGRSAAAQEKLVIEASATLAADDLAAATDRIRSAVRQLDGKITWEQLAYSEGSAHFVIRVPPAQLEALFSVLGKVGELRNRWVNVQDVTREYQDTELQLANMEQALERYRQILAQARTVEEMLAVERELTRLKGEIERLKGARAYLADRVDLATLTLDLLPLPRQPEFAPRIAFRPGLRLTGLQVLGGGPELVGPGLSLFFLRQAHLELDLLARRDDVLHRADGIRAAFGTDVYSDFLGRGRRTWLNPHLGMEFGYVSIDRDGGFLASAVAGLELLRTGFVLVDTSVALDGLLGVDGAQLALTGTLTLDFAF